jgi:demethylmenaquinone methyltransferase/2-methoxy-6-polyprenyl-1,4-benzoquinol methylase
MLEIAAEHAREEDLAERPELAEMGVTELDAEEPESYDAVMSGLCFSELSEAELRYTLTQVARILRPGGLLLLADEVMPQRPFQRFIYALIRAPLAALAYLITQQTSRPARELPERVAEAGLSVLSVKSGALGSLLELVAQRPAEKTP